MTNTRTLLALGVVTVLVAAGAVVTYEGPGRVPESGELVYPHLLAKVNEAAKIEVRAHGGTFELERRDGRWVAPARHDYPAAGDRVHQLLLGAAGLRRIEPKTSNPELYAKIGVQEPDADGAVSVRYRVTDAAGAELLSLLVGRGNPSHSDPEDYDYFVRVGDDQQAWLVEGRLPTSGELTEWLDRTITKIERPRIRRVEIVHPDGARVTVARDDPFGDDFALRDVAPGAKVEGQWHVNDIGRFLETLELDDVRPASELDVAANRERTIEVTTFDGLRVGIETAKDGEATWAALDAEFDPALVETFDAGDGEARERRAEKLAKLLPAEDVEREAKKLNARWAGWIYRLPDFKVQYAAKRMEDLAKPAEPTSGEAGQPAPG